MSFFRNIFGRYEALESEGKRRPPRERKVTEERILTQRYRDRAGATLADIQRNDVIADWALNKYLDYGTVAYFAAKTEDAAFNDALELEVSRWCRSCDIAERNDFDTLIRLMGRHLALDGDAALLKCAGGLLQGIETDRIRGRGDGVPAGMLTGKRVVNGVLLDKVGKAEGFLLYDRGFDGSGFTFARLLRPEDLFFIGNFIRFDQVRGVPMLLQSAAKFQDVDETDLWQMLKVKNHAAMALAITSAAGSGLDNSLLNGDDDGDLPKSIENNYDLTAGTKIELEPGDQVNLLESHTPSNEYREFSELQIRKALLNFGLSYSFFDSSKSSYSAMKQDRAEFKFSIMRLQRKMLALRYDIMDWVLPYLVERAGLTVPAGGLVYEWLPQAEPWLEEDREVTAALNRISAGLSSPQQEARKRGQDAFDIARDLSKWQSYIRKSKTVVAVGTPGAALFNGETLNEEEKEGFENE